MRLLTATLAFLSMASLASAQTLYGSLVGNVSDSSGGAIVQANITLTNSGTGDRRTAQSGADGAYQFVNLPPGQYRVEVEKTGFRRLLRDN
ncbi:MAG: carboxypeptidase-like regulatory domain-containing protein, partial [Acidobacteriota bacterium]